MAPPSLGHYAALSFVVRGRGERSVDRGQQGDTVTGGYGDAEISNFGFRNADLGFEMWDMRYGIWDVSY
jgi:hypothetical protein